MTPPPKAQGRLARRPSTSPRSLFESVRIGVYRRSGFLFFVVFLSAGNSLFKTPKSASQDPSNPAVLCLQDTNLIN